MREITLEELLEAGCHFGHQVTRQNPKARDFIFEARDNIHIIDLAKTKEGLEEAGVFVRQLATNGGTLVVVGTKRQAHSIIEEELERVREATQQSQNGMGPLLFSVTSHWKGGTLTNFQEASKNYKRLKDLSYRLQSDEEKEKFTKKEIGMWDKDRQKLEALYGGIADMKNTPDALFIVDTHLEHLAVREAQSTGVKTVGVVDTNADPNVIDYPIPANDDAVGSLKLIVSYIMDAWIEGFHEYKTKKEAEAKQAAKEAAKEEEARKKAEAVTKEVPGQTDAVSAKKTTEKAVSPKKTPTVKKKEAKKDGKRQSPTTEDTA